MASGIVVRTFARSIMVQHPSIISPAIRCFTLSSNSRCAANMENPTDFSKVDYAVPKDMVGKILGKEKRTVNEIKALSGSVIRHKRDVAESSDPNLGYFTIGGSKEQINKAIELIEQTIAGKTNRSDVKDAALIWSSYRRNFKGQRPPQKPRYKCIRSEKVAGNPCPLCKLKTETQREAHYKDIELLKQFVCSHTGKILEPSVTGLCRKQQEKIVAEIDKSRQYGLLPFTIPLPNDSPVPYKPVGIPSRHIRVRK